MEMMILSPIIIIISITLLPLFMLKLLTEVKRSRPLMKGSTPQKLQPPGPWKLPLVGSMHHLISTLPHRALANLAKKYGPLMHVQLGEISLVVVSSGRLAKEVMKTHDIAFASRPQLLATTIVGYNNTGISFSPYGAYWRQMRKVCTIELLSAKKVRSFCSIRDDEVWHLIESTRTSLGSPINISQKISSMITRVTCRTAFGKVTKDQDTFIALTKEIVSLAGGFDVADLFPSLKLLHTLTGTRSKLVKIHKKIDEILDLIINEHRERLASRVVGALRKEEEDLVDVLLRLKECGELEYPITSDNIKAILLEIFAAGTDTSSATIEWAMSEMMRNPRVMKKAQDELRQALNGKAQIQERDIQELSYLKKVIKETMRFHPVVPLLLPRECREEREIDGYNIPIKTKVIVNSWAIGRDPEYWSDAENFIPERFDSTPNMIGAEFEYLPFGAGRRMCPGMLMGLANVELPLAQLLYHFDWKLPNGMKPEDLDISETFGATVTRKTDLYLIPISHSLVN